MLQAYGTCALLLILGGALSSALAQEATNSSRTVVDWSGVHLGLSAGWRWPAEERAPDAAYYEALGPYGLVLGGDTPGVQHANHDTATLGTAIGYRKQFGKVVLGSDLDAEYATHGGRRKAESTFWYKPPDPAILPFGPFAAVGDELSERWIGRARIHVGVAFERWLLFVAGGAAYRFGDKTTEAYVTFPGGGLAYSEIAKTDPWGWVLGGGVEYALTEVLSVKFEYMHSGFSATNYVDPIASAVLDRTITYKVNRDLDNLRVGLTYRLRAD